MRWIFSFVVLLGMIMSPPAKAQQTGGGSFEESFTIIGPFDLAPNPLGVEVGFTVDVSGLPPIVEDAAANPVVGFSLGV